MSNYLPLTVVIPTYERQKSVVSLCKAVLLQLEEDDELLVVNDGSKDGTAKALSKINQVRLISNSNNEGMVKTWNKCLVSASHDWICMIHDDDEVTPYALKTIRKVCSSWKKPAIIGHQYSGQNEDNSLQFRVAEPGRWAVLRPFAVPSGVTIHKSIVESVGLFDEQFKYSADIEYFSRICKYFTSITIENPQILVFNLHGDNFEFRAWKEPDILTQLEELERRILSYAELTERAAENYFNNKMNSYIEYIFYTSSKARDTSLLRKFGILAKNKPYLTTRNRIIANFAALFNWFPKIGI